MTTQTATATQTVVKPVGRPLSKRGRSTKAAITRFLKQTEGQFTVADVRKAAKQSKVTVRNHITFLERQGHIKVVGHSSNGKPGRPQAVYEKVENPVIVNHAVRRNRQHVRLLAAMTPSERKQYVAEALIKLYEFQIEDERRVRDSLVSNGQGFTKYDALKGTNDAVYAIENGTVTTEQANYWLNPVSASGRTRIGKYQRQL